MSSFDNLSAIAPRLCQTTHALPGHAPLLDALRCESGVEFAPRVSRGGWFRPGRILTAYHEPLADNALAWLEAAWLEEDQDGDRLAERLRESGYWLSRQQGRTHYLVASYGDHPTDFFQLEIEELQEMVSHPLGAALDSVDSLETLLQRPEGLPAVTPLGAPRYHFRRVNDMAERITTIAAQPGNPPQALRFIAEWTLSSAGQHRHLSDHWILALSEHRDRYHQRRYGIHPVAAHPVPWQAGNDAVGIELAHQLHDYDRHAGYSFAWYFQMLSGCRMPRNLPLRVHADVQADLRYLPERDLQLIIAWVEQPYTV